MTPELEAALQQVRVLQQQVAQQDRAIKDYYQTFKYMDARITNLSKQLERYHKHLGLDIPKAGM